MRNIFYLLSMFVFLSVAQGDEVTSEQVDLPGGRRATIYTGDGTGRRYLRIQNRTFLLQSVPNQANVFAGKTVNANLVEVTGTYTKAANQPAAFNEAGAVNCILRFDGNVRLDARGRVVQRVQVYQAQNTNRYYLKWDGNFIPVSKSIQGNKTLYEGISLIAGLRFNQQTFREQLFKLQTQAGGASRLVIWNVFINRTFQAVPQRPNRN